jgi:hypothetical protein
MRGWRKKWGAARGSRPRCSAAFVVKPCNAHPLAAVHACAYPLRRRTARGSSKKSSPS